MKKEIKKEEILRSSLKIFAEYGYKKTTIEDIADELGIATGTIYLYTKNKRDLYLNAVACGFNRWQQRVRDAVTQAAPEGIVAKLKVIAATAFEYLSDDSILRKVLQRDPELFPLFESKDPYTDINNESVSMLKDILAEGVETGIFEIHDIDETARSLFFIYVMFIQKTYVASEGEEVKKMFGIITDLMMKGLLKKV